MNAEAPRQLLFVYGSLRRGERHHAELRGARFVREARTAPRYAITSVGEYRALAAGGESIAGELFEVDAGLLARLDEFEGEEYRRGTVELESGEQALSYVLAVAEGPP